MYDELFENPAVVARYRAGPYAKSREQFLKKAQANGYSPRTLMRMAWALLVVAEIVRDAGGSITPRTAEKRTLPTGQVKMGRPSTIPTYH